MIRRDGEQSEWEVVLDMDMANKVTKLLLSINEEGLRDSDKMILSVI
jgi:hypothetical protein